MNRKAIGIAIIVVFAAALVFGAVGSALEVVNATATPASPPDGEYVTRLATSAAADDPALAALKYICPFH